MESTVANFPVGTLPSPGVLPERMHAQVIRAERFGEPELAFREELVALPNLGPDDVLVGVMVAGLNYNNVWAALGHPVNVIQWRNSRGEVEDFHIGGSDAAGIVCAIGDNVSEFAVGDEVVVSPGQYERSDPFVCSGGDPALAPSLKAWGYETNWGSFAQFCLARSWQCYPRPKHLTWEESASYLLCGATAMRMLCGWPPNVLKKGATVLVWGGSGGLGSLGIQIVAALGGQAIAVVNSNEKADYCRRLGAAGVVNRSSLGLSEPETPGDIPGAWQGLPSRLLDPTGAKLPHSVFEHPGQNTVGISQFVCGTGGMIVICAGTTGYCAALDGRDLVKRSIRFQGSHFAGPSDIAMLHRLIEEGKLRPSVGHIYEFGEIGAAHGAMRRNEQPFGNNVVRIGLSGTGFTNS